MSAKIQVFSSGGGTQSCAIAALIIQGRLPKPDFVCIVDTERERGTTWQYMDEHVRPALASVGLDIHRIQKSEWGSKPAHGMDYLSHNGNTVLLPAFTNQTSESGKLSGFCSKTWKVETQDRYCREVLGIATKDQRRWIGFSLDETSRALRMMKSEEYAEGRIWFPLIHGVPLKRAQAIALVQGMGWPMPPRSACWNCPNQSDYEWLTLKLDSPDEFRQACELEVDVQKIDPFIWFHKSCIPLSKVDFSEPENLFSRACDSGACFV